jgi:hypothetical protein
MKLLVAIFLTTLLLLISKAFVNAELKINYGVCDEKENLFDEAGLYLKSFLHGVARLEL